MANEEEIIVSNNDFLSTTNRKRRSTDDNFWTPEKIAEVNDDMPEPGQEYFDRFGIQPINEVQLLSNDGEDNVKIKPADLGIEPWKHFGKLFYKYKRRFGYCSAAFVDRQVLITAAHCIKHTDSWHTNFHFYHRYNTDVNPGTPVNVHKVFIPRKYDIKSPFPYGDLR